MKERLRELLRGIASGPPAKNLVREFLQASVLGALQRAGAMVPLAFQGGTALRFLYSIRRHSEDLDFALERPGAGYDFRGYLDATRADLKREGYGVDLARVSDGRAVHSAFVRFPGLLYEMGLAGRREVLLDGTGDHVARRERTERMHPVHEPPARRVDEHGPLPAQRLGDEERRRAGLAEHRRVKLDVFEIHQPRTDAVGHRDAMPDAAGLVGGM